MSKKIKLMSEITSDMEGMASEYSGIVLFGSAPDGDVPLEKLVSWISDNQGFVEWALATAKKIDNVK